MDIMAQANKSLDLKYLYHYKSKNQIRYKSVNQIFHQIL